MTQLSDYVTSTQRLLHDSTANYWSVAELVTYINEARNRVTLDTGCNRVLQTVTLTTAQEQYPYTLLPQGTSTVDVLNITVLWGTMRVPLNYMVFTEFNMKMRAWQSYNARPVAFTVYGNQNIFIGPIPDQNYVSEWDTVVLPPTLVNQTDTDTLMYPFTSPVPFYAAYLAKYKEQSYQEADKFKADYVMKAKEAIRMSFTRRLPSVFGG